MRAQGVPLMSDERQELPTVEGGPGGERCETCYYWECGDNTQPEAFSTVLDHVVANPDRFGWCHRYPPRFPSELRCFQIANGGGTTNGLNEIDDQPVTHTGSWCGEWRAKPGAKSAANVGGLLAFPSVTIPPDGGRERYKDAGVGDWIERRIRGMKKAYRGAAGQGSLCNHYRQFLFSWVRVDDAWFKQLTCPSLDDLRRLMDSAPDDVMIFRHLLADNRLSPPAKEFVRKAIAHS